MASLDLPQFLTLAQERPEVVWKGMERFVMRNEQDKLLRLIDAMPAAWWGRAVEPRSSEEVARDAFWNRAIKRSDPEVCELLFSKHADPLAERHRVVMQHFTALSDARNDAMTAALLPAGEAFAFTSKHWESAFRSRNNVLFDRINPQLNARRALTFVENYFFDLQLNQLRRLSAFIPDDAWPLKFARDAISRFRGPGMISFFIDKGFKASRINPNDVRACLLACVRADNSRALEQVLAQIHQKNLPLDFSAAMDVGDVTLHGSEDLRIIAVKLPPELRESPLVETAILRGNSQMAQSLIDAGAQFPSQERMQQWLDFAKTDLHRSGVKAAESHLALANAQSCHDILAMIQSASPPTVTPELLRARSHRPRL